MLDQKLSLIQIFRVLETVDNLVKVPSLFQDNDAHVIRDGNHAKNACMEDGVESGESPEVVRPF